jgi:hypothetical protein
LVTVAEHHDHPQVRELLRHLHGQLQRLGDEDPEIQLLPLP